MQVCVYICMYACVYVYVYICVYFGRPAQITGKACEVFDFDVIFFARKRFVMCVRVLVYVYLCVCVCVYIPW